MTEPVEPKLPHAIALAWGLAEPPQRGPKRELSLDAIIDAAIAIADAEGIGALSMSRVASSLGFTTMSLYRYVTSKDDLLQLMQNSAARVVVPPLDEAQGWREALREWFDALVGAYRKHPWTLDIPVSGVPMMPTALVIVDWAMRAMRDLPLDPGEKIEVLLLLTSYARATAQLERDLTRAGENATMGAESTAALTEVVSEEAFPYLFPLIRDGVYAGGDPADFEYETDMLFGLERILDGIESYTSR
ncbi:TetR/AcrR family transcriptional regulator C-terminal domain-containing protein [Cryobacterium sp. BB307]|uniref:TetR/AcrR family transcriptional regulator n=1 Tax=Cryobacterium sp. BB307 TaxID=2716317 RepID=UPI0014467535|nr:TetR/AcrR family transcriptional regulator C-terminal domain-containing protein [Cryobacterium sp. BB307]